MTAPREDCPRCRRPLARCVCASIAPIATRTGLTVLQHPAERDHAFNTARLLRLALPEMALHVAWDGGRLEPVALPAGAALLWPGPDALDLAELPPDALPAHLVAIDGTWPQARAMIRLNPWLAALPRVRLSPEAPSTYRIRREPRAECLSTIECVTQALGLCEPDNPAVPTLLDGFHALIDGQLDARATRDRSPRPMSARPRAIEQIAEHWDGLVVVYAETTPLDREPRAREIAQWAALRPATGERFDALARPSALPNDCQLRNMGLDAGWLLDAPDVGVVAEAWAAFARPTDRYAAWSRGGAIAGFSRLGVPIPPLFDLKSLYCNVGRGRSGTLDQVIAREGLAPEPVDVRGRAAGRLANSAAVAGWLRRLGEDLSERRANA